MPSFQSVIVNASEIDLTTVIPTVSTTEGGITIPASWGPVGERVLVESADELVDVFGKPTINNYEEWFTASNFLDYGNQLWVVREVDSTNSNTTLRASNASANNVGFLVKNDYHYETNYSDGSLKTSNNTGDWIAKFPGDLGNSLRVSVCDSANAYQHALAGTVLVQAGNTVVTGSGTSFTTEAAVGELIVINEEVHRIAGIANTTSLTLEKPHLTGASANVAYHRWAYYNEVDLAPGTTEWVSNKGGSNDEMHVVVIDENGIFTGVRGTILEVFQKVSKASDARLDDGSGNYYKEVINKKSRYIRWAGHANQTNYGKQAAAITYGGSNLPISASLGGGKNGSAIGNDEKIRGYDLFKNPEELDMSLLLGANATQTVSVHLINNIAEFRKDCLAVLSPPRATVVDNLGQEAVEIVAYRNTLPSTSYAVLDTGWKYQYDKYNDVYRFVPLNGDIAGLMVQTDNTRDPWWSPAGFNRGNIKNVLRLAYNPSKTDRDLLYKNGINPVVTFPGDGTVLYGDKTLLAKPSAFDRINVRRLFIVLRKAISRAAKYTLFEFNDDFTRAQFRNMVEPYLRDVQGRRGIYDFRAVCDSTNNTAEVIDRNEFVGDIYIKPARSINFIQLNFVAVRTGVDFSEITGKF